MRVTGQEAADCWQCWQLRQAVGPWRLQLDSTGLNLQAVRQQVGASYQKGDDNKAGTAVLNPFDLHPIQTPMLECLLLRCRYILLAIAAAVSLCTSLAHSHLNTPQRYNEQAVTPSFLMITR